MKSESGRDHLLLSFEAFLDLYEKEGGNLNKISIGDMIKWCSSRCGHEDKKCSSEECSCGGSCRVE